MNLNQVTIPSIDVVRAMNFYKKLGLKLIVHTHDAYVRFECPDGDSTFSIHQESEIIKRTLRDMYDENTKNIIIEGNEGYKKAQNFMKMMMPSHVKKIKKYRGKIPLFIEEDIEQKLNQIFPTYSCN